MSEHDWKAKIVAAHDAVEKAAALLLEHAEGLGALAMMERNRERAPDLREASLTPSLYLRDGSEAWEHLYSRADEDRRWNTIKAAIVFAAVKESQLQASVMQSRILRDLRYAVEDVAGPDNGPPPSADKIADIMGDRYPGVRPEAVHRQAWLNYLVASAVTP